MKQTALQSTFRSRTASTTHRDVTERLREAILSGSLAPGTHLVQADLAAALEVSVTPVREALRDLESQGLVDSDPFRGAVVHRVSLEELDEIYELRSTLIPLAVQERVNTITDSELLEAAELVQTMTVDIPTPQWVEDNRRLHRLLDGEPRKKHLGVILRKLADVAALYVGISVESDSERRRRARDDHRQLVDAYQRRDADAVVAITLRHFADTAEVARAALLRQSAETTAS